MYNFCCPSHQKLKERAKLTNNLKYQMLAPLKSLVIILLLRPKLVWCTYTFSNTDMCLQIEFYLYGISTGEPDQPSCKVSVAVIDIATGLYAHGAIIAGLISQECTGHGLWIDCNLLDSQVSRLKPFPLIFMYTSWWHPNARSPDWQILHQTISSQTQRRRDTEQRIRPSYHIKYSHARMGC